MTPNTPQPLVMRSGADSLNAHTGMILNAIDGAIAYGKQNINPPPSGNHWLAKFWNIGRRLAELENPAPVARNEDECAATGEGCSPGPHGPNSEVQCRYCGEEPDNEADCRRAYDDTYHKVPAEIGYDHWRYVWMKACKSLARK